MRTRFIRRILGSLALGSLVFVLVSCASGTPPSLSLGTTASVRTAEGDAVEVPISIAHPTPGRVSVVATSDSQGLIPDAGLEILGTGADRTLRITPASTGLGTAEVTIRAQAGGASDSLSLTVDVTPAFAAVPQKLVPSDVAAGDFFGFRVALGSDHAVVGSGATDGWSVYPVDLTSGTWDLAPRVTASDANVGDSFGWSLAIDGDRAVIGAYLDDEKGADSGAAYVFERTAIGWTETAKLVASDATAGDRFGRAVDIHGSTIVVGAPARADGAMVAAGAMYVFEEFAGVWQETDRILSGDADLKQFGDPLSLGSELLIVGATRDDDLGVNAGAAYVFRRSVSRFAFETKLKSSDGEPGDSFGAAVAVHAEAVVVGAPGESTNGTEAGAAYVFEHAGGVWSQAGKLMPGDAVPEHYLADSVAIHGAYVLVSAAGDDEVAAEAGAAYLFKRIEGAWTELRKLTAPDGAAGDFFAFRVALSADYAMIGADSVDAPETNSGAVYLFQR